MKIYNKLIFTVAMLITLVSNGYSIEEDKAQTIDKNDSIKVNQNRQAVVQNTSLVYTCSMHPEVISDKPGKCPKCGMELIVQNSNSNKHKKGMMSMMHGEKHHSHVGMYIAGGVVMIAMMVIMIL